MSINANRDALSEKLHYTQLTVDIFKAEFEGTPIIHQIYPCVGSLLTFSHTMHRLAS